MNTQTRALQRGDGRVAPTAGAHHPNLNLYQPKLSRCGGNLLNAAARKCKKFFRAEANHIRRLFQDPDGVRRAEAQAAASAQL